MPARGGARLRFSIGRGALELKPSPERRLTAGVLGLVPHALWDSLGRSMCRPTSRPCSDGGYARKIICVAVARAYAMGIAPERAIHRVSRGCCRFALSFVDLAYLCVRLPSLVISLIYKTGWRIGKRSYATASCVNTYCRPKQKVGCAIEHEMCNEHESVMGLMEAWASWSKV